MHRKVLWIIVLAVLLLGTVGTEADELRIKVLENQEFKIEGDNVRIVGKLEITKGDLFLTAGQIVYNSELKTAVITGDPYLQTKDATVDGQKIEAEFEAEVFTITGSVRIQQAQRSALADQVHIDNIAETYLLLGNVLVNEKKDEKELRGEEVLINSRDDSIEVRGPVEISFQVQKEPKLPEPEQNPDPVTEEVYVQVENVSKPRPQAEAVEIDITPY